MSINRYNYEEFFLLYVDNELSINERAEVEEFAMQNPDLNEELQAMRQSVLTPDRDVVFPGKESLLQPASGKDSIHAGNYQEFFVLYGDDELSSDEKAAVEQFVYHHPQYQEEFELILEVRFTPDPLIVFPRKKTLYRYEKDARPLVVSWWKIAAAAIVILIAGFTWFNQQRLNISGKPAKQTAKSQPGHHVGPAPLDPVKKEDNLTGHPDNPVTAGDRNLAQPGTGTQLDTQVQDLAKKEANQPSNRRSHVPNITQAASVAREPNKKMAIPIAQIDHHIETAPGNRVASNSIDVSLANTHKMIVDEAVTDQTTNTTGDLKRAMLTSNEDAENVILANIPVDKKNSLRGLFRKASRFIDKNTALRSGQKSGILIGNIEIAFQ